MRNAFIVTGTDTGVGKTVFSAMLTLALGGVYWKPMQSGRKDGTDTRAVQRMTGLHSDRFIPERYSFSQALSPHRAAELDKAEIDVDELSSLPQCMLSCLSRSKNDSIEERPVIIEGAGGLLVPITRRTTQITLFKRWKTPVILCARTGLGTINHTLLSIEALWARGVKIHGIAFIGDENEDNVKTIAQFSKEKILGRMPILSEFDPETLLRAFKENFKREDFE